MYRRWLFEPELRPAPITANQDLFFLEILKHSSLIFQPRAGIAKEVLPTHVKLCESVLEVYRRMAKDVAMTKVRSCRDLDSATTHLMLMTSTCGSVSSRS